MYNNTVKRGFNPPTEKVNIPYVIRVANNICTVFPLRLASSTWPSLYK